MKVFVVISAGGSFSCNYATDLCIYGNYANDNACCIFAGFQVLLSITGLLVDLSVTIMQVTVSAANIWVTIFIVIMQMGVSVAIIRVVFFAVHYAHDCFHCYYAGDSDVGHSFK